MFSSGSKTFKNENHCRRYANRNAMQLKYPPECFYLQSIKSDERVDAQINKPLPILEFPNLKKGCSNFLINHETLVTIKSLTRLTDSIIDWE